MKSGLCRETEEGALGEKSLSGFRKALFYFYVFFKKKYYIEMENCGSFKSFGFIYIYIYIDN